MVSRNSTGPSPSANPARRSFIDNLTSLPQRQFAGDTDMALLNPAIQSPAHGADLARPLTPPNTHGSSQFDSPELTAPPQRVSYSPPLLHPSLPYASNNSGRSDRPNSNFSSRRSSFASDRPGKGDLKARPISLSVNYVPAKFTRMHNQGEGGSITMRKRRKQGGGREAFADDAGRMGQMGMVDDDEGVEYKMARGGVRRKGGKRKGLRWNRFKALLFAANTVIMLYGLATLVAAILVWLNVFSYADVIRVGNKEELIVSTVAAALCTLTAVFGYSGIILNNRAFLAVYTLLLWIDLGFIAAPGYMTYKQRTFNLEGKLNQQWSRYLGTEGRLRIQDALVCCGYFSPFIEATQSPLCYSRSNLPGCKARYLRLERTVLGVWYAVAFGMVGAHIIIIVAALLCSNHVTYRFGKGLTPKRYRLDLRSMGVILDDYANQIAAQYGDNVAQEALTRSVSRGSGSHTPLAGDNMDFGASRRGSFAHHTGISPSMSRQGSADNAFRTSTTGYNSQAQAGGYGDSSGHYGGYGGQSGPGAGQPGVRLVSQQYGRGAEPSLSNRGQAAGGQGGGGGGGEWYEDAVEDGDGDPLGRMEVSTGYGSDVGASGGAAGMEGGGARRQRDSRASVGWAQ